MGKAARIRAGPGPQSGSLSAHTYMTGDVPFDRGSTSPAASGLPAKASPVHLPYGWRRSHQATVQEAATITYGIAPFADAGGGDPVLQADA